jgi:hypothetical protein
MKRYRLGTMALVTHHQFAAYKTCPGTQFPMDTLKKLVQENQ